jgi:hypothetical protein
MRFRRKRETWGVTYTNSRGEQLTVWFGSRAKALWLATVLQSTYPDVHPVRLPHG